MAFWLVKSEPGTWSWDDQVRKGAKGEPWTGVRNHGAKLHLMAMKKAERALFYHSGDVRAVVGIAEIIREAYPDPTGDAGAPWVCVDIKAIEAMPTPVTLDMIKQSGKLGDMVLVKNTRLSVQPVKDAEWKLVCKMGGMKA